MNRLIAQGKTKAKNNSGLPQVQHINFPNLGLLHYLALAQDTHPIQSNPVGVVLE